MATVRRELMVNNNDVGRDPYKALIMVDALQRLGIDYHFKDEIEQVLERQYMAISPHFLENKDLRFASLCFRLLRQQHYYVSADAFENYMNKERKLEKRVIRGESTDALMSFYEASQLRIKGEDVLDEAEIFSCQLLKERIKFLNHHEARTVSITIAHPHHRSLARFTKNHLIKDVLFIGEARLGKALQELANSESAFMQALHKRELSDFSRWWNALGLAQELKLARDQPLKWFTWSMSMLTDHSLSDERIELTKPISLIYVIDDIYDVYGTIDELTIFTEAWARLCTAFLEEAKWFVSGHFPGEDEYLENGIVSSGVHVVLVHMFFLIGDGSTKERAEFVKNNKFLLSHNVAAILRLWDDLGSAQDENQDGKDGSYVACYMKEHEEASIENARKHVSNMISETWKCLNKECLSPSPYSEIFIEGSLNLARMVPLMYAYDDSQSLPLLEYIREQF